MKDELNIVCATLDLCTELNKVKASILIPNFSNTGFSISKDFLECILNYKFKNKSLEELKEFIIKCNEDVPFYQREEEEEYLLSLSGKILKEYANEVFENFNLSLILTKLFTIEKTMPQSTREPEYIFINFGPFLECCVPSSIEDKAKELLSNSRYNEFFELLGPYQNHNKAYNSVIDLFKEIFKGTKFEKSIQIKKPKL